NVDAVGCGPGPDWVDSCLSGTDTLNSLTDHGVVIFDVGPTVILPVMRGIVVIFRGDHTGPEPQHIDTEMVSLQLSGGGLNLRAGDGTGDLKNTTGSSLFFSPGRITENGTGLGSTTAASFFDVFFELSPTPFGPLHNALQPPVAGGPFPNACIMDFPT